MLPEEALSQLLTPAPVRENRGRGWVNQCTQLFINEFDLRVDRDWPINRLENNALVIWPEMFVARFYLRFFYDVQSAFGNHNPHVDR